MTDRDPSTDRGRIHITGFDPSQVTDREPLSAGPGESERSTTGRWRRGLRRFRRNRSAMVGLGVVAAMTVLAVFARPITVAGIPVQPVSLAPYDPTAILYLRDPTVSPYDPPSLAHPLGIDGAGRDVFSRILYGGRYSISIGVVVVATTASFGVVYGAVAGYYGGWIDEIMMRLVDAIYAFPPLIPALIVVAMLGGGYWQLVFAFGLFGWAGYARLIRGEVLSVAENEYVAAAKALGARDRSVVFRHVVPNALAPVLVVAFLDVGTVVIGVAALGFLGLGLPPGTAEWGTMLEGSRETLVQGPDGSIPWWATVSPGGAIFLFVLSMTLIGDGINDAFDVRATASEIERRGGDG